MDKSQGYPPQPPEIERKLSFYKHQIIGITIILLVVLLSLLGVFGTATATADIRGNNISVEIIYPTRLRYKTIDPIIIKVNNLSDSVLETVTIQIDQDYLENFSTFSLTPSPKKITDNYYEVELNDVAPNETRLVSVSELQAEKHGRHVGDIVVSSIGGDSLALELITISLP